MNAAELVDKVREYGVVGAGGAGFPAHVKLAAEGIDTYLINGAECEPLLEGDQHLMKHEVSLLAEAGRAVAEALGAKRFVFGLKKKYVEEKKVLEAAGIEVVCVGDYYPLGDEVILIKEVTGRIVPEGGLPLQVGVVVSNVETLYNIGLAMKGQAVTHTFVTVGGAVANPGLWLAPVGTIASELVDLAGGVTLKDPMYIDGGPMTGSFHEKPDFVLTKTSNGILVVPSTSALVKYETMSVDHMLKQARYACIQCNQCTVACSRNLVGYNLEPHKIMRAMAYSEQRTPDILKQAFLCSECNLCSGLHACPMQLSPKRVNQELKKALKEQGIRPDFPERELREHPLREYRLLPSSRLVRRLGLAPYDVHVPFRGEVFPGDVRLPLTQHLGAPAVPVVSAGDMVEKGQLVAEIPEGALGARIHASVTGTVKDVSQEGIRIVADKREG